ncbi:uncharacterized protein Z518_04586 [Rhinocladiella mackenziei CBS 650.93]|uniref:Rhinocladiella mackenziei CBS 650.93 unplaced genomic scaffold supercont1.3, whole genome shotgun sequence n=1 Tax=Rhinocladiella mackenziei CBS 650.93 TaxID=1442369 RepID=A0A0D2JBY5_9EURO|nr:uncharacterized protein Z518_04586 [Rhinocladiella mackenziei CBS 650.93]KIX06610.1 hypothetical protein Z518_04586 [Rhinocladiella mackenziei CBS 650.93]
MTPRQDFDVVIVGGSNTACCTALAAHEAGAARVAILEAAPKEERGGNARFSGTAFRFPHQGRDHLVHVLCDEGKEEAKRCTMGSYTAETFTADMLMKSNGRHDRVEIETIIKHGYDTVKWMSGHGVPFVLPISIFFDRNKAQNNKDTIVDVPPGLSLVVKDHGVGLNEAMWAAVEKHPSSIQVFYASPAHDLILDGDRVLGVRARHRSGYVDFFGRVILCSGGFEANPRMRRQYLGEGTEFLIVRGTRFNTGVMLERAIVAGAQAHGHWGGYHSAPQDLGAPKMGDLEGLDSMSRYSFPYSITVNLEGNRFVDEGEDEVSLFYSKMGAAIATQPDAKAFQIFDQKVLHLLEPRYSTGAPITDGTLEGLAKKMGVDPTTFVKTVEGFNRATQNGGKFDPFRKDGLATAAGYIPKKSNWAQRLDAPPYVAYGVTNGITFTFGGIKTDARAKVLNNEGRPMDGLWAAGEITGGFYHGYAAGASLIRSSVLGRIAGTDAAVEAQSAKGARL